MAGISGLICIQSFIWCFEVWFVCLQQTRIYVSSPGFNIFKSSASEINHYFVVRCIELSCMFFLKYNMQKIQTTLYHEQCVQVLQWGVTWRLMEDWLGVNVGHSSSSSKKEFFHVQNYYPKTKYRNADFLFISFQ